MEKQLTLEEMMEIAVEREEANRRMKKTISNEDWELIRSSFNKRDEKYPHAAKYEDPAAPYLFTTERGILEQIENTEVGKRIMYMDWNVDPGKISLCDVIEDT